MGELGLFDDLPRCLVAGEPFVEYGVIEYRYRVLRARTFADIVSKYSHRALQIGKAYTASNLLASALRQLVNRGELELRFGSPTGFFASYLEVVSYWALAPAANEGLMTWATFASASGLDSKSLYVLSPEDRGTTISPEQLVEECVDGAFIQVTNADEVEGDAENVA